MYTMAHLSKAKPGDMIDDVPCPHCSKTKLYFLGIHKKSDKPYVFECMNCFRNLGVKEKTQKALQDVENEKLESEGKKTIHKKKENKEKEDEEAS